MSEHTKGPWWIEVEATETRIESELQTICENVSNCDAPLIASGPDLLKMLHSIWVNIPSTVLEQYGLSEVEICSLITKAKG